MDTKDLRYFRQVCELGSINQAARQLFITPQGLSRAIRPSIWFMDRGIFCVVYFYYNNWKTTSLESEERRETW